MLGHTGYTVLAAPNGADALDVAARSGGPIHLLLTDVVMQGMSGRELAERLTAQQPETRVLYMSGYTDDAIGRHGVLERGTRFLQKPFTASMLLGRVREALSGEPPKRHA
jgi:DNA-binding response OmpR family regulator